MHAPHVSPSSRRRSIYASSIPVSHAEALYRRHVLEAHQRAYRDAPPARMNVPPRLAVSLGRKTVG
jgi:hypothetical protein